MGKLGKTDKNRKKMSRKKKIFIFLAVFLTVFILAAGGWLLEVFVLRGHREMKTGLTATNTTPAVYTTEAEMDTAFAAGFPKLSKMLTGTIVVPGLRATETLEGSLPQKEICTSMTPQGLAVSENYIFISAYCHTHRHNSVIYMLNRKTHDYIKTIVLPGKDHVGGMGYDTVNNNLWVSGGTKGAAKAIAYSMKSLEDYNFKTSGKPIHSLYDYTLVTITRNSYMSYASGALLIGYFTPTGLSQLERFDITDEGGLHAQIIANYDSVHESVTCDFFAITSGQIQSAAESGDFLMLSKSFGTFDSALQIFDNSVETFDFEDKDAAKVWRFPQKLEQIYPYDGKLYCLFESAAYAYRAQPALCLDRILVFNVKDMLSEQAEAAEIS